jgi:hypothetical protein
VLFCYLRTLPSHNAACGPFTHGGQKANDRNAVVFRGLQRVKGGCFSCFSYIPHGALASQQAARTPSPLGAGTNTMKQINMTDMASNLIQKGYRGTNFRLELPYLTPCHNLRKVCARCEGHGDRFKGDKELIP